MIRSEIKKRYENHRYKNLNKTNFVMNIQRDHDITLPQWFTVKMTQLSIIKS